MSTRRKHRKFPSKNAVKKTKRQKDMGKILPKVNVMNCYPPDKFKVISVPKDWANQDPDSFIYLDRIGKCCGTDRLYGAKLQFDTGEMVTIPFDNLEAVRSDTPGVSTETKKETQKMPVVAQEVELVKGNYYKLLRKPTKWDTTCKYVGQTGLCMTVDDRGARLRFNDGNDISFQADVLEETPAIDLSSVVPQSDLCEKDIVIGELYIITKAPEKFGNGKELVGKVGKAKWPHYRGVCLNFPDTSSYVIPLDCVAKYVPPVAPNPITVAKVLNANSIVIGRKYRIKSVPGDWKESEKRYAIGQFAEVIAATDIQKQARVKFDNKLVKMVPFDCIEDLPRPTEDELIALIKQHPDKLLHIIQQINNVTRLKPLMDFCSTGDLPYCKEESATVTLNGDPVYGPQLPVQHSAALLLQNASVSEASDEMMERVVTLFNVDEAKQIIPAPVLINEVAAED